MVLVDKKVKRCYNVTIRYPFKAGVRLFCKLLARSKPTSGHFDQARSNI